MSNPKIIKAFTYVEDITRLSWITQESNILVLRIMDMKCIHPDILQKLTSAYEKYAQDVGVVIPTGQAFYDTAASATAPVNQSQITITPADIAPANFTN